MSLDEPGGEKPHEPSPRKLQKAREKGEFVRSPDLNVAASYLGFLVVVTALGPQAISSLGSILTGYLANADQLAANNFVLHNKTMFLQIIPPLSAAVSPWFLGPFFAVLLSIIGQRAFVVTPSKLKMRASRINPISNAKNKYGRTGMFEFAKSSSKLLIYCICLAGILASSLPMILTAQQLSGRIGIPIIMGMNIHLLTVVACVAIMIGVVDYMWQYFEHHRRQRMTRKELTDEAKEAEGDPHFKQKRRQKAQEIASRHMLADVAKADVIVVNPTHFAVALKWDRNKKEAPRCVAKGTDEVAGRIRELAQENGVPIHSDPPTARALFSEIKIGDQIALRHFEAVAAAIRFADSMRSKRWRTS